MAELFNKYGSDKDRNGYSQIYHTLFFKERDNPITLLEIGIGTMIPGVSSSMVGYSLPGYKPGGSLRAWRDYFINGRIIGVDVQPDTQFTDEPRIETHLCDTTKEKSVLQLFQKLENIKPDVILDDGSHYDMDQLETCRLFYPHLKEGGIYIIEDVTEGSRLNMVPSCLERMCNGDPFFFVGVKNNICIIYKQPLKSQRLNY